MQTSSETRFEQTARRKFDARYDRVERRNTETGETYYVFFDRTLGATIGTRHATREAIEARAEELIARDASDLAIPCVVCGEPAGDHVNYECPAPTVSDALRGVAESDLRTIEEAIEAHDAYLAAQAEEGEIFARWMRFERDERGKLVVHGLSVRAAERRTERAWDVAYDAVSKAAKVDEKIAEEWGFDLGAESVAKALRAARERAAAKIERAR